VDKRKKRQIDWFLRLINTDLQTASFDGKLAWLNGIPDAFERSPHPELSSLQSMPTWDREVARLEFLRLEEILVVLQQRLRRFLNEMLMKYEALKEPMGREETSETLQLAEVRTLGQISLEAEVRLMVKKEPALKRSQDDMSWEVHWPSGSLEKSALEVVVLPKQGGEEGFLLAFMRSLDGVSLSLIRKCCMCSSLFLQSGRTRRFCSSRCRAREGMRVRRAAIEKAGGVEGQGHKKEEAEGQPVASKDEKVRFVRVPKRKTKET